MSGFNKDALFTDMKGEKVTRGEREITCPNCGHVCSDSWERRADSIDDEYCDECGATYAWERDVSVDYSSVLVKPPCPKEQGEISSCDEGCAINGCERYEDGKEDYEPPLEKDSD
jgi:hypothetical protein